MAGKRIQGWMGRPEQRWLAEQAARYTRIIEVGVWKGRSTQVLANATAGCVWAVDHWRGTPASHEQHERLYSAAVDRDGGDSVYAEFRTNLGSHIAAGRVKPVRMSSLEAAETLLQTEGASFDFIFIDADHSYESCTADISAYRALLAPGGMLAGHDYSDHWPGVQRAVQQMLTDVEIGPATIWSCRP